MRQELGVKFHGTGGLELAQALKNEAKCGDDLIGAELLVISVKIESPRVIEYKPAGPGGSLAEVVFAVDNKELLEFEVEGNIEVFDGRAANRALKVLNGLVLSAGKIKVVIRSPPDSPKHWDDSHVEEAMRKTSRQNFNRDILKAREARQRWRAKIQRGVQCISSDTRAKQRPMLNGPSKTLTMK
jgi:hypothetical protein